MEFKIALGALGAGLVGLCAWLWWRSGNPAAQYAVGALVNSSGATGRVIGRNYTAADGWAYTVEFAQDGQTQRLELMEQDLEAKV